MHGATVVRLSRSRDSDPAVFSGVTVVVVDSQHYPRRLRVPARRKIHCFPDNVSSRVQPLSY